MTRLILILLVTIPYIIIGRPDVEAFLSLPYMVQALVYPLLHANLLHLLVNIYAIYLLFDPRRKDNLRCLTTGLFISFLVYPLSFRPVIGISNLLYAVIGMRAPSFSSPYWKSPAVIIFLAVTVGMVFIPSIAASTHIAAFVLGVLFSIILRVYKSLDYDYRRIKRRLR